MLKFLPGDIKITRRKHARKNSVSCLDLMTFVARLIETERGVCCTTYSNLENKEGGTSSRQHSTGSLSHISIHLFQDSMS